MLISLNWLKEYVDINESIEELENALTMIGQEVESIDILGKYLDKVYIGQIVEFGKHPDSDKLTLLKVDIAKGEPLQIICGATNHKLGDKVAVATEGAVLPGEFKIKKAKVRGVDSCGMLASEKELGIGKEDSGIIILPESAPLGTLLKDYLELNDVVFELEITPNRPDCLSHIGIAREISAYYNRKLKYPVSKINNTLSEKTENLISVDILAKNKSRRYTSRVIKNVKIGESPLWLQNRLKAIGLNPINNIVDITNFVLMEYNHPMHAFDLSKISGSKLIVREAKAGEKIVTLDEKERILEEGELVIADKDKIVAIAGVMGGANSEIDENTRNIVLEVAHFDANSVRKTSKRLGLSSDSSYRFERGIDVEDAEIVINRATSLIQEIAGGEVAQGIVDKYPVKYEKREIKLNLKKLYKFIGKELNADIVGNILTNLDIELVDIVDGVMTLIPPSYRDDLTRPADLYEEVIRMYGFNNIEAKMPLEDIKGGIVYPETMAIDSMKQYLSHLGLQEVINYSFVPKNAMDNINYKENTIDILNPISEEMITMRPSLIYSLLTNIRDNFNRNQFDLSLFEVSRTFRVQEDNKLANENPKVAIAIAGKGEKELWNAKPNDYDFYDLKAYVEGFLESCGLNRYQIERSENPTFHPGRSADIKLGKDIVGTFGEIHPDVAENLDIKKHKAYIAEFDINKILKYSKNKIAYKSIVKYPAVERDLAIVVAQDILVGNMITDISKCNNFIEKVELFDVYQGDKVVAGKKSVAINIILRSDKGTLEEKDINNAIEKILSTVNKKYNGEIRQ